MSPIKEMRVQVVIKTEDGKTQTISTPTWCRFPSPESPPLQPKQILGEAVINIAMEMQKKGLISELHPLEVRSNEADDKAGPENNVVESAQGRKLEGNTSGVCGLCGEPMPPGEEMFKFHGYSGPCPTKPEPHPHA
jgi:hypothetical protein